MLPHGPLSGLQIVTVFLFLSKKKQWHNICYSVLLKRQIEFYETFDNTKFIKEKYNAKKG